MMLKYYLQAFLFCYLQCKNQCNSLTATCDTKLSDLNHSISKVICPSNCWRQYSDLCGSDDYASGPLCLAAMHAGLMDNGGGYFEVYKSDSIHEYKGLDRNGVRSKSCSSAKWSYTFEMKCNTIGNSEFSVTDVFCPPGCSSNYVCGTNSYNKNSSVCASAIHAGILSRSGGYVTFYSRNGRRSFIGSTKDGVISKSCGSSSQYFSFTHEDCLGTCSNNGECLSGVNDQHCSCNPGLIGSDCEIDINECVNVMHNCHQHATCINTVGSFQCSCNVNYTGDGIDCYPDFCAQNPGICQNNGTCIDTQTSYNCSCAHGYSGSHCEKRSFPTCKDALQNGLNVSGVYSLTSPLTFQGYCDMDGAAWLVFQRRYDGSVSFDRDWIDYKNGFGDLSTEFWMGLEKLHQITSASTKCRLRVDLQDFSGGQGFAEYSTFSIGDEGSSYTITISGYSGNLSDSMTDQFNSLNGIGFTARNRDQDTYSGGNCAQCCGGAWWHRSCSFARLNGPWSRTATGANTMSWYYWKNSYSVIMSSKMKVKCE